MSYNWEITFFISDNILINDTKVGVATLITVGRVYITFFHPFTFLKKPLYWDIGHIAYNSTT